jgi:hypothetical protein
MALMNNLSDMFGSISINAEAPVGGDIIPQAWEGTCHAAVGR